MKILITSISSDSHTWNLVFMQLLVEELGHEVYNLGSCVPIELLVSESHKHKPDMIIVSSVNGHGHIEGVEIINAIKQCDFLKNITMIIGGKLGTLGSQNAKYVNKLLEAGYDQVFDGENAVESFINFMEQSTKTLSVVG
jgi:methylmalonyl-CoA mutase cobalamin-binding subunit